MEKGFIKFYKEDRGFGFIKMDNGEDMFVHFSDIADTEDTIILTRGMEVTFDITDGLNGKPKAVNVTIVRK